MSLQELKDKIKHLEEENSQLKRPLSLEEYSRYGRQMIVPQFGIKGQLQLKHAKVLVIGAGGLGCPALLYLTSSGVGKVGIVDNDTVDKSNLHRQVLHTTSRVGKLKCDSAKEYLSDLNPNVQVETFPCRLSNENVFSIFEKDRWDLVLDCTDTPLTRYLINDAAVLCNLPIVSGSGLQAEGQLSVLNFRNMGPCYRCFYPRPPPPNAVTSCSDGGVLPPAIGAMGTFMVMEAIKVLTGFYTLENFSPFLSVYSGYPSQTLRKFKMRAKRIDCAVCGESPSITRQDVENGTINYSQFCGSLSYDVVEESDRVSVEELADAINSLENCTLLDVRPRGHFEICSLPNFVNIPWDTLKRCDVLPKEIVGPTYVTCRYGNDSRLAVKLLKEKFGLTRAKDVKGGLSRWSDVVDRDFPKY